MLNTISLSSFLFVVPPALTSLDRLYAYETSSKCRMYLHPANPRVVDGTLLAVRL